MTIGHFLGETFDFREFSNKHIGLSGTCRRVTSTVGNFLEKIFHDWKDSIKSSFRLLETFIEKHLTVGNFQIKIVDYREFSEKFRNPEFSEKFNDCEFSEKFSDCWNFRRKYFIIGNFQRTSTEKTVRIMGI